MWRGVVALFSLILPFTTGKTVDLSQRKLRKEDFFTKIQSQINLQDVTDLILRQNEFDSFLDCSTNLESLRTLDLSQNHLQRFFFLCKDEYNLQVLNVSHNKLEYVDDNALNDRIPKLKILDLSFNRLSVVNETMLEHLKILEFLSLANNPIGDNIHENAFWNLTALKRLDLRNVSASYFPSSFFKTLKDLSTLDISWNPISELPLLPIKLEELDVSGTSLVQFNNFYLPQLRELRMNHMANMTSLSLNDLEHLTSLEILSAVGCKKLVQFEAHPGANRPILPRLQRLSVQDCALQTLTPDLRRVIVRTAVVDLQNNPWRCDCKMQWVNSVNSSSELSREIRCQTPNQHHNKLLREIPSNELECEYVAGVSYSIIWISVAILLTGFFTAAVFFVLWRPVARWAVRRRNRDTVTYTNVVESSNDLVRILTVGESHDHSED